MKFLRMLRATALRWYADSIPRFSAALAYYTFFSMAPLLVIAIAISGLFFGREASEGQVMLELQGFIGKDAALAVQEVVRSAWKPGTGIFAMILGVLALFIGAIGVLNELKGGLDFIWKAEPKKGVRFLVLDQTKLLGFIMGVGFLLVVSLLFSTLVSALGTRFSLPLPEPVLHLFNLVFDFSATVFIFASIFKWLPDTRIAWRDVWVGAAFTAVLFMLGKFLLALYLGKSGLITVYGAAASLIMILVWIYYSSIIFYFGAEFTKIFSERAGSHSGHRKNAKIF